MQVVLSLIFLIGSMYTGFFLAGGNPYALWQPFEIIMLGGAAIGFFFAGNSKDGIKSFGRYFIYLFKKPYNEKIFSEIHGLMFALSKVKNKDPLELNRHLTSPEDSEIFKRYPLVLKNPSALSFLCNNFLLYVDNGSQFTIFSFEEYLEEEISQYHAESLSPYKSTLSLVDTMPAMGIMAAVLGITISMQHLDSDIAILGSHISSALFGTFFGIFLAYAIFKPLSMKFASIAEESDLFLSVIKNYLICLMKGYDPLIANIVTNKSVPPRYRMPDHLLKSKLMKNEL